MATNNNWDYHIAHNTLGNPCTHCDQPMSLSITISTGWTKVRKTGAVLWMECKRCNWAQAGGKFVPNYDPDGLGLIDRSGDEPDYDKQGSLYE